MTKIINKFTPVKIITVVWWQNGDLGLGRVLEYIQRFIVDSGRWDPTDHKSD